MAYIYWLIIFIWLPLIILWVFNWNYLVKYKGTIFSCFVWSIIFSVPWDLWAVYTQIWIYPKAGILGVWVLGLPIEEYFFILTTPTLIATVTLLIKKRIEIRNKS